MVMLDDSPMVPMGSPDPALAGMEMEPGAVDDQAARDEKIKDCVMRLMRRGHDNAVATNKRFHDRMALYRRLRRAIAPLDGDPNDPLAEMWTPTIGAMIESGKSQELTNLVPDPASMDFIEVHAEDVGLDDYCQAITQKLRNEYRSMRPQVSDNGLVDLIDRWIEDRYVTGNCLATSAHQVLSGHRSPDEQYIGGCVDEHVDPMCTYPWNISITSARRQKFTFYDPATEDDLERMGIPDDILEEVRDKCVAQPLPPVDPDTQDQEYWLGDDFDLTQNATAYKRIMFSGMFPWSEFRREWGEKADDLPDKAEIVSSLARLFGFDLASVELDSYWDLQWIYPVMIRCRPLQLELAPGAGPIRHEVQYKVAGQFWGEGFYDRAQWHERLANFFEQCGARIAGLMADPPTIFRKYMLDMDHLQLNGITPRLERGMAIFVKQAAASPGEKPVESILLHADALGAIFDTMAGTKDSVREILGVYADVQGQSTAKTATQGANNLQQGLVQFLAAIKRFENGFLRRGGEADYVIMCQAITMGGVPVNVPISIENKILSSLTLTPEMLLPLGPVSIRMTGSTNPGNRQHMIENALNFATTFVPLGAVDAIETAQIVAAYMDLPNKEKLIPDPSGQNLMKRFVNAKQILGDAAIQYFSPMDLMKLGLVPPPTPQVGPDGKPVPGGQSGGPPQAQGLPPLPGSAPAAPNMAMSGGNGGPPMMAGNNGFSRGMPA